MKIKFNSDKHVNFGISVSPKMKYIMLKETKKFYTKSEALNLLSLIESGSDKYCLKGFKMSIPNKRTKSIYCDIFINSKLKNGGSCIIHTFLGKFKNKEIQYKPLENLIKNLGTTF